ncbi:MAG: hypothetical protein NZ954_00575 [Thermofilaceae archaeon]|nr:hypothetical protein [Thermofilaceae archaeon]MCX8180325.1 hypothetical protein [Thermofilaceae archaeon]MDW8003860.1 Sip1-related alpha-galactosidase [Thermofilaceae archaeon]
MNGDHFKVRGSEVIIERNGFRLVFKPRFSLTGELSDPISIEESVDALRVKYEKGEGRLLLSSFGSDVVGVVAEAEGYSSNGILVELRSRLEGFQQLLLFHFTYDPDKYFAETPEPYQYPQFREAGELEYSPWSFPVHTRSFDGLPSSLKISQFLAKGDKGYVFLLPISDSGARGYMSRVERGEFSILLNRLKEGSWNRTGVFVFSTSIDPYKAVESAYEAAFSLTGKLDALRKNKRLPEVFRYLGWCSWNACWREPTEEKVVTAFRTLLDKGVKPGFTLIDDGWQDEEDTRIRSLNPDPRKFPVGFAATVSKLKEMGSKYVGLWHTLNVHWRGIAKGSELAERWKEHLLEFHEHFAPDPGKSFYIFRDWYSKLRDWRFDFVKVDNQSSVGYTYAGRIPIEAAAKQLHEGLEAAAYVSSLEVLNCMSQQPENVFNWFRSAVARNCIDYIVPHKKSRNKLHLYFNAYNALFMSQVVWPDWDMFQSHDPWALQQAVARATSGGPVYLTDEPGKTVPDIVKPLAFTDGSLPLPDFPALPTEDTLMRDPYNEAVPLKVFTQVSVDGFGTYGLVAAFNINRDDSVVSGAVTPSDALLPEGRYWIYEYFSNELREGSAQFKLNPMDVKLFIIVPRASWLAPIGLREVYIMPRAIEHACVFDDEALLKVKEPGLLFAKTERKVKVDGGEILEEEPLLKVRCLSRVIRLSRT